MITNLSCLRGKLPEEDLHLLRIFNKTILPRWPVEAFKMERNRIVLCFDLDQEEFQGAVIDIHKGISSRARKHVKVCGPCTAYYLKWEGFLLILVQVPPHEGNERAFQEVFSLLAERAPKPLSTFDLNGLTEAGRNYFKQLLGRDEMAEFGGGLYDYLPVACS